MAWVRGAAVGNADGFLAARPGRLPPRASDPLNIGSRCVGGKEGRSPQETPQQGTFWPQRQGPESDGHRWTHPARRALALEALDLNAATGGSKL